MLPWNRPEYMPPGGQPREWSRLSKKTVKVLAAGLVVYTAVKVMEEDNLSDKLNDKLNEKIVQVQVQWNAAKGAVSDAASGVASFFASFAAKGDLLPPAEVDAYGNKKRTLVIALESVLISGQYTRDTQWVYRWRPNAQFLLRQLAQDGWEVVLWSDQLKLDSKERIEALDENKEVKHFLFREDTSYKGGAILKNLDRLNRDPSRVIVVDSNPDMARVFPDNTVLVSKWDGRARNRADWANHELEVLILMLANVAHFNVHDLREVVRAYRDNRGNTEAVFDVRRDVMGVKEAHQSLREDERASAKLYAETVGRDARLSRQAAEREALRAETRQLSLRAAIRRYGGLLPGNPLAEPELTAAEAARETKRESRQEVLTDVADRYLGLLEHSGRTSIRTAPSPIESFAQFVRDEAAQLGEAPKEADLVLVPKPKGPTGVAGNILAGFGALSSWLGGGG